MAAPFEVIERTNAILYGRCAGIWVMTVYAEPKLADMKAAHPALESMAKTHAKGFPTMTWVLPQAGLSMESDARKAASEITRAFAHVIRSQATLIEQSGFHGATIRAIVSGLDLVTRSPAAKKVFSELPKAVAWSLEHSLVPSDGAVRDEASASLLAARNSLTHS